MLIIDDIWTKSSANSKYNFSLRAVIQLVKYLSITIKYYFTWNVFKHLNLQENEDYLFIYLFDGKAHYEREKKVIHVWNAK